MDDIRNLSPEDKHKALQSLCVNTFGTTSGAKYLKHLETVFIDRDMYKHGMTLDEVAFRQGQADVIKQIKKEFKEI